uniref:Membrane protein n=1 Tax=Magnetospirillum gryphiswaldense TaxID=55518 RepID=A4TTQ9_9PROT|nr:membrane protein [Magnetospirillum gryphiswaldense MSR-1]
MKNTSNSPLFSGFILGAAIFLAVILLSYTMVFATTLPDTPLWLRVALTLLLVSLIRPTTSPIRRVVWFNDSTMALECWAWATAELAIWVEVST